MNFFAEKRGVFLNTLDAIDLLKRYGLYEKAKSECRRLKLDEAPYDMQGHNRVFQQFLDMKQEELTGLREKKQKCKCNSVIAIKSQSIENSTCLMNKTLFDDKGFCESCLLKAEVDDLTFEINALREASKALQKAAEYDYIWR